MSSALNLEDEVNDMELNLDQNANSQSVKR